MRDGWTDSVVNTGKPKGDGDAKWGDLSQAFKPQDISVNDTVAGDATVHLEATIVPSQWFETRISKIENTVVNLKGTVANGGNKLGQRIIEATTARNRPSLRLQT